MLKIRLARGGSKKRPYYHIVIAASSAPRDGKFIEKVGAYNPMLAKDHADRVVLKPERIAEWLKKGAQPTERVARFLSTVGLVKWEHGNNPNKGTPGKKAQERAAERTQREQDRIDAEAAAKESAKQAKADAAAAAAEAAATPVVIEEAAVIEEAPAEAEAVVEADVDGSQDA